MKIKQVLITGGLGLIFVLATFLLILFLDKSKASKSGQTSAETDSDMASHHAPPAPVDDAVFKSLLGQKAPDFSLESYSGQKLTLSDLKGKNVVLFFSEGAMCYPGCWNQIDAFVDDAAKFADKNTAIFTIIVDPRQDWQDAVAQDPKMASANVLLDAGGKVSSNYGVLTTTSSMHRGEFPGHTYIILDKEGIVRYLLDDEDMQIRNKELLKELEKVS